MYLGVVFNGDFVEFMLIDPLGNIHGRQIEHYVDLIYDGDHDFRGMIESGVARVCLKAGIGFKDIVFAYFAVPEYGEHPEYDHILNQVISRVFPKDNYMCENDVEAAMTAAFGIDQGIVVLVGAGSVALAKNYKQETSRSGGWGRMAGDEAGEYWYAKNLLEIFTKEADGRYESSILYNHLKDKMQLEEDLNIIHFSFDHLEDYGLNFEDFLGILFESAILGDPYASEIISRGIHEVVLMVEALGERLDYMKPIQVALIGRLFSNQYPIREGIEAYFSEDQTYAMKPPRMSLVAGAALKAMLFKTKVTERIVMNIIKEDNRLLSLKA